MSERCCPSCGASLVKCEMPGCDEFAMWEGWRGRGLVVKTRVCEAHKSELRGAQGEAARERERGASR